MARGGAGLLVALFEEAGDGLHEALAVVLELDCAHAVDGEEAVFILGAQRGHLAQGLVAEDHVRGHAVFVCDGLAQGAQLLDCLLYNLTLPTICSV